MCRLSTDIVNIVIDYVDESRATNIRNIVTVCYSEQKVAKFYIDYYKFLEKSLGLYESGENAKLGSGDESESKGDSPENISFKRNILVLNDPSLMKKLLLKEEWEGADKYVRRNEKWFHESIILVVNMLRRQEHSVFRVVHAGTIFH